MRRALAVALAGAGLVAGACHGASRPGYATGTEDRWSFPLVGALEAGPLLTPITVDGQGPFLFALDPDAPVTILDEELVAQLGLAAVKGPDRVDATGTPRPRFYAEVRALELGTLLIERREAMIASARAFDTDGRRVLGVLGKDVLVDSLVLGIDRDGGVGHLVTASAFQVPAGAVALPLTPVPPTPRAGAAAPAPRHTLAATVGGQAARLHLDLGAAHSQLRDSRWAAAQLPAAEAQVRLVDEVGTARTAGRVARGALGLGPVTVPDALFVPYDDARFPVDAVDGAVGVAALAGHVAWTSWAARTLYLAPRRTAPLAERARRWEVGALDRCPTPGCVTVRLVDPLAGKPVDPAKPHPGLVLSVTRAEVAGGMGLEVILEPTGRPELPRLAVNLPATAERVLGHLPAGWVGVTLEVVDVSPFPRACPDPAAGCVDTLAR